jgi:hypothetical protein
MEVDQEQRGSLRTKERVGLLDALHGFQAWIGQGVDLGMS